jgi:hypothetical protein
MVMAQEELDKRKRQIFVRNLEINPHDLKTANKYKEIES